MITLKDPVEFEWDEGNRDKNWQKHQVSTTEIEEVFLNDKKRIYKDALHSKKEDRYLLIGATEKNRALVVVFTIRKDKVRVISARDLNKKKELELARKVGL